MPSEAHLRSLNKNFDTLQRERQNVMDDIRRL